jgi:hypothetical protein
LARRFGGLRPPERLHEALRSEVPVPEAREVLVLAQQPTANQRHAVLIQARVLFDADVIVAEVVRHQADLAGDLDQFEKHFRVAHGVALLLTVMRNR